MKPENRKKMWKDSYARLTDPEKIDKARRDAEMKERMESKIKDTGL